LIQLAKEQGLKVIASAGSDEKVAFMKEIGADVTINYKTQCELLGFLHVPWLAASYHVTAIPEVLEKEGPIDM
jgi:NADPH:quinone reductase-like Zn-dependent oxidoreductase